MVDLLIELSSETEVTDLEDKDRTVGPLAFRALRLITRLI